MPVQVMHTVFHLGTQKRKRDRSLLIIRMIKSWIWSCGKSYTKQSRSVSAIRTAHWSLFKCCHFKRCKWLQINTKNRHDSYSFMACPVKNEYVLNLYQYPAGWFWHRCSFPLLMYISFWFLPLALFCRLQHIRVCLPVYEYCAGLCVSWSCLCVWRWKTKVGKWISVIGNDKTDFISAGYTKTEEVKVEFHSG